MRTISPLTAIRIVFFVNGALFASWASRIPALSDRVGASPGSLGLALLAPAVGAIVAMPAAGRLLPGRSSRRFCRWSTVALCAAILLPGLARSVPILAACLLLVGVGNSTLDLAMNAQGVTVERRLGRPILSSLHADFSFGGFAGAGLGGLAAALGVAPLPHVAGHAGRGHRRLCRPRLRTGRCRAHAVSLRGRSARVSTGPGLAAVSSLGYLGCLAGPPLIGGVAQLTSLRLACGLLSLAGLLVVLLATFAGPSRPRERVPVQSWVS